MAEQDCRETLEIVSIGFRVAAESSDEHDRAAFQCSEKLPVKESSSGNIVKTRETKSLDADSDHVLAREKLLPCKLWVRIL